MYHHRLLPTSQRPMPLEVDSSTFIEEWKACWEDKNRSMELLLKYMRPWVEHWKQMLYHPEAAIDINYLSMCARLNPDTNKSLHLVRSWIRWAKIHSSVEAELWLYFIEYIRTVRYFPKYATPLMAEYVIASGLRDKLKQHIQSKSKNLPYRETYEYETETIGQPVFPDYFYLKNMQLSSWDLYIFAWSSNMMTSREMASSANIGWERLRKEERHLWHLLNESYSRAEALIVKKHL